MSDDDATENTPSAQALTQSFIDGDLYQRKVAETAERLGPESDEFRQWCRDMDAWRAATQ